MKIELLNEINRYRELVGLPIIKEAAMGSGFWDRLISLVDDIANEAVSATIQMERLTAQGVSDYSYSLSQLRSKLDDVARIAGVTNTGTLKLDDLINLLKTSTDNTVRKALIKVLSEEFTEVNRKIVDIMKTDVNFLKSVDELDPYTLRETLKSELGLYDNYIDDLFNTIYKNVDANLTNKLTKLGMNWDNATTQTLRTEVYNGLTKSVSNADVQRYAKWIQENASEQVEAMYNTAIRQIAEMPGGLTTKNAETFFNNELAKMINFIKTNKLDRTILQRFASGIDSVLTYLLNLEKIKAAKTTLGKGGQALFVPIRLYCIVFGIMGVMSGIWAGVWSFIDSEKEMMEQYLRTEEGQTLYKNGDMVKFKESFNQWKKWYMRFGMEFLSTLGYPLMSLKNIGSGSSSLTDEDVKKAADKVSKEFGVGGDKKETYTDDLESFKKWMKDQKIPNENLAKMTKDLALDMNIFEGNGMKYKFCKSNFILTSEECK